MGLLLLIFVVALSLAIPVKCYNDGQYKMRCLELRGTLTYIAQEPKCELPESKDGSK